MKDLAEAPQKKYLIKTFGCQMNVADTERMHVLLTDKGMLETDDPKQASLIVVNGCSVREKAVHKAVSTLGRFQDFDPKPIIGVGGCVGQLQKKEFFARAPYVDFVFGTDTIDQLPEIVHEIENGKKHLIYTEFDKKDNYSTETKVLGTKSLAFVNIMKGCDKFCTYCIVPFTRGREKSRSIDEVLEDLRRLVKRGVREVTLLGQNVNSFGKGNVNTAGRLPLELHNIIGKVGPDAGEENFPQLLWAIENDPELTELKRLRFTSSHPLDFSDELIDCYHPDTGVKKLARQLHLPVQCGSNRVLQKMGRHHKIEGYFSQMKRLREMDPDIGLSTDLIVGFPTETEEEFQETLRLLDTVQYDTIYAFAYSPRPGTRAFKLEDDVHKKVKLDRLNRLLDYQLKISDIRNKMKVGQNLEVLVEGEAKYQMMVEENNLGPGLRVYTGHSTCNRVVNFVSPSTRDLKGKFAHVKIQKASGTALQGELA